MGGVNASIGDVASGRAKTLAERLREGPLALGYALQSGVEIARAICELHDNGRVHGAIAPEYVSLTQAGIALLPVRGRARYAEPAGDVAAFGALLYEMVHGVKLNASDAAAAEKSTDADGTPAAVARLAARCIRTVSNSPQEMQKALTEVRLLAQRMTPSESEWMPSVPAGQSYAAPTTPARPPVPLDPELDPVQSPWKRRSESTAYTPVVLEGFLATAGAALADPAPSGVNCPRCGLPYVYPSRPRTWFEALLSAWKSPPQRCHRCLHRFVRLFGLYDLDKGSPKPEKG